LKREMMEMKANEEAMASTAPTDSQPEIKYAVEVKEEVASAQVEEEKSQEEESTFGKS